MAIKDLTKCEKHLFLCNGSSCSENGAEDVIKTIRDEIRAHGLHDQIHTTRTLCNGRCDDGPIVIVEPEGLWYKQVGIKGAKKIVYDHLKNNRPIKDQILYQWGDASIQDS